MPWTSHHLEWLNYLETKQIADGKNYRNIILNSSIRIDFDVVSI